jgi:hypothetical protein
MGASKASVVVESAGTGCSVVAEALALASAVGSRGRGGVMGTSAAILFNKGFDCPWCGAQQVVDSPVPVDVVIRCDCGKVFRVVAEQRTGGILWRVEQLD